MTNKLHYIAYLKPCRPDFAQTLSESEYDIMSRHFQYWIPFMENGTMMIMGLVADPVSYYGMGILEVDSEEHLKTLLAGDPASQINTWEYAPMHPHTRMTLQRSA